MSQGNQIIHSNEGSFFTFNLIKLFVAEIKRLNIYENIISLYLYLEQQVV